MKVAGSLDGIAAAATLTPTRRRFIRVARTRVDRDLHRGDDAHDRIIGDPTTGLNPSLGAIAQAPLYAVQIFPGDVGVVGVLVAGGDARLIDADGEPIPALPQRVVAPRRFSGARACPERIITVEE